MAFLQCNFTSAELGKQCSMNVILPENSSEKEPPVLFLFHGLSDDYFCWCRRTSIERYASAYNCAVIMPDGGRSFYTDMVNGGNYWSFISEELPQICANLFNLSLKRENCFAAGLSMGGYGALKLGLRCPQKFAAVAALSPVVDLEMRLNSPATACWEKEFLNIFGPVSEFAARGNDLYDLARKAVASKQALPKILSFCGDRDFMIEDNRKFNSFMNSLHYPEFHSYERPGIHCWEFWDRHIQDCLKYFFTGQLPE